MTCKVCGDPQAPEQNSSLPFNGKNVNCSKCGEFDITDAAIAVMSSAIANGDNLVDHVSNMLQSNSGRNIVVENSESNQVEQMDISGKRITNPQQNPIQYRLMILGVPC